MDLAQTVVEDARTLLAVVLGGFGAALAMIVTASLLGLLMALSAPSGRRRGPFRSAWR